MFSDLESKLQTSECEANVCKDALRHEVSALRKRWQDAVHQAEGGCLPYSRLSSADYDRK